MHVYLYTCGTSEGQDRKVRKIRAHKNKGMKMLTPQKCTHGDILQV